MKKSISYRSTIIACYIGNFTQSIVVNLTPIIFIPLREAFGFSYGQFGLLILSNFFSQIVADLAFSKIVDKYGFRPFVVGAHLLCIFGFLFFILTPTFFQGNEFVGFLIATIIFSSSGGLLELLLSPIINSIPSDEKAKAMALLHSFYAWGQVGVVLLTTLCLFLGLSWRVITLFWTLIPLINVFLFSRVPLPNKLPDSKIMKIKTLILNPIFLLAFLAILFGGASEVIMGQWASTFIEEGLALPKLLGDILGICGFAVMLGIGRLIYGIQGEKININKILIIGSGLAMVCYLVVALSPFAWLSVLFCALTGICVSLLWPGTLVVASQKLPFAGTSLFAFLAAGGDMGASFGPWLTGIIADVSVKIMPSGLFMTPEQFGLRAGVFVAALFPLLSFIFQLHLKKRS